MKRKLFIAIIFVCCVCEAKDKEWKDGKMLSYNQETFTTYSQTNGTGHETPHTTYKVQIDAGDRIVFAERTLNWAWQKFPSVTENGPISWCIKGKNQILIKDEKGKDFTLTIVKTRIKSATQASD